MRPSLAGDGTVYTKRLHAYSRSQPVEDEGGTQTAIGRSKTAKIHEANGNTETTGMVSFAPPVPDPTLPRSPIPRSYVQKVTVTMNGPTLVAKSSCAPFMEAGAVKSSFASSMSIT